MWSGTVWRIERLHDKSMWDLWNEHTIYLNPWHLNLKYTHFPLNQLCHHSQTHMNIWTKHYGPLPNYLCVSALIAHLTYVGFRKSVIFYGLSIIWQWCGCHLNLAMRLLKRFFYEPFSHTNYVEILDSEIFDFCRGFL